MTDRTAGGNSSTSATAASAMNRSRRIAGRLRSGGEWAAAMSGLVTVNSLRMGAGQQRIGDRAAGRLGGWSGSWAREIRELATRVLHVWPTEIGRDLDGYGVLVLGHDIGGVAGLAREIRSEVAAGKLVGRPPQGCARDDRVVAGVAADVGAQIPCRT